jgi:hypothetical protein
VSSDSLISSRSTPLGRPAVLQNCDKDRVARGSHACGDHNSGGGVEGARVPAFVRPLARQDEDRAACHCRLPGGGSGGDGAGYKCCSGRGRTEVSPKPRRERSANMRWAPQVCAEGDGVTS